MTDNNTQTATVIPLRKTQATQASEKKWGKAVMNLGFSIFPSLILRGQQRLGLNPTQLAILLHLADYWWDKERHPYPSKQTLSDRLGLSPRQIQRYIADLEKAGFLQRKERSAAHRGKLSNEYNLSGLVERLKQLEPEFREAKEKRRRVMLRGAKLQDQTKK